jgi:hypothetical protein
MSRCSAGSQSKQSKMTNSYVETCSLLRPQAMPVVEPQDEHDIIPRFAVATHLTQEMLDRDDAILSGWIEPGREVETLPALQDCMT